MPFSFLPGPLRFAWPIPADANLHVPVRRDRVGNDEARERTAVVWTGPSDVSVRVSKWMTPTGPCVCAQAQDVGLSDRVVSAENHRYEASLHDLCDGRLDRCMAVLRARERHRCVSEVDGLEHAGPVNATGGDVRSAGTARLGSP